MRQHPFMFLLRSWVTGGAGNVRKNCSLTRLFRLLRSEEEASEYVAY